MIGAPPTDLRKLRFDESVRAPWWLFAFLGLLLGGTAGGLTGVGVKSIIDEPLLSGGEAAVFYLTFGFSVLISLFILLNFTVLLITASDDSLEVRYGIFSKRWSWDQIDSVRSTPYRWTRYGGWGIRWAQGGRRAWSMPGARLGVELMLSEGGKTREYYISSNRPDELERIVGQAISHARGGAAPRKPA